MINFFLTFHIWQYICLFKKNYKFYETHIIIFLTTQLVNNLAFEMYVEKDMKLMGEGCLGGSVS